MGSNYGYCPHCDAAGVTRERRPNGNDRCENGHVYPSSSAVLPPEPTPPPPPPPTSKPAPAQLSPEMLGEEDRRAIRFVVPAIRSRLVELEDELFDIDRIAYTPAERAEVVKAYKRAIEVIDLLLGEQS